MRLSSSISLLLLVPWLLFLGAGCGKVESLPSNVKVTNGQEVPDTEYPSVILLYDQKEGAICTGTFISDDTVLTAAHCTMGGAVVDSATGKVDNTIYLARNLDMKTKKIEKVATSIAVYRNPQWDDEEKKQQVNKWDLGIVVFPKGTAKAISKIAKIGAAAGDDLTIVGYGLNYIPEDPKNVDKSSVGKKRVGQNQVAQLEDGFIYFTGTPDNTTADGTNSCSSSGDSGGPMFINDKLVGVTSGGGRDMTGNGVALYIDLQSNISKGFLNSLGIKY